MEIEWCQEIDLVDDNQFSEAMGAEKEVDNSLGIDENGHLPELQASIEPDRNQRNGRYNLRKSLAWDSAFFTSAGVLDAEELSSMITETDKMEKPSLPGIQEEITGSIESLSTLESDNLNLDACEDNLFEDVRASIQRSNKKAPNLTNSRSKVAAVQINSIAISTLKKEEIDSEDKNPKPGLKNTSSLLTGRISKSQPKQIVKLTSGKSINQDSVRSQVSSFAKTSEINSILQKPPKSISSSIPSSTATAKWDCIETACVKSECGNSRLGTVSSKGQGTKPSKMSFLSGSRKLLPKPAVSSKSSLLDSSTSSVKSTRSSSLSDISVNASFCFQAKLKSTLTAARRNPRKPGNDSIGPSHKPPPRATPKNKLAASSLTAYLMSAEISSSVSPASSISEWSSASSSCSMVNQRCNNSRASLDTGSSKSVDSDNVNMDTSNHSAAHIVKRHEIQGVILPSNSSKKSSTQAGSIQAPAKPSGLRMPSPKIGFFDGVKSPARTPNGHKQSESGLRTVFSKKGDSTTIPVRSSNSKMSVEVPLSRMISSSNIKSASPKATSPVSFQAKSHASNASSVPTDVNDLSSLSVGAKGSSTGELVKRQRKLRLKTMLSKC